MTPTRTFPIRLAPLPGEALDSWLEALAHRLNVRLGDVLGDLGLGAPVKNGIRDHAVPTDWTIALRQEEAARIGGKGIIEHDLTTGAHTFHPIPPLRQWVDLPSLSGTGLSPASLDEAIRATVDNLEGGIDDKIVRLVVRDVPRHILRELDHKALREYKRRALQFHLDTRRPEIVRRENGEGAPGRRASLADTVRDKLRSRVLTENIDREALVELGLHYLREADLVAGPTEEDSIA